MSKNTVSFRDLAIGETFRFPPESVKLTGFSALCTKVSARCYTWQGGATSPLKTQVGSINVGVQRAAQ